MRMMSLTSNIEIAVSVPQPKSRVGTCVAVPSTPTARLTRQKSNQVWSHDDDDDT
jgi:hypothetical protein